MAIVLQQNRQQCTIQSCQWGVGVSLILSIQEELSPKNVLILPIDRPQVTADKMGAMAPQ